MAESIERIAERVMAAARLAAVIHVQQDLAELADREQPTRPTARRFARSRRLVRRILCGDVPAQEA